MPSIDPFANEKMTRAQRERARITARYVADHPDSLVVRATVGPVFSRGTSAVIGAMGLFFNRPRTGHLVADGAGIRMMQARNDAEWDHPWSDISTLERADRFLKIEVVSWYTPKLYYLCRPDGEPSPASGVADLVIALQALRAAARSAAE